MKKLLIMIIFSLGLVIAGCSNINNQAPVKETAIVNKITAKEAKARLDNEKGIILLDVRTPEEYAEVHIPNAILLPIDTVAEKAETVIPDKEAVYFVYCRSGNRSATASKKLVEMDYKNIYDLGGIIDWPYEKVAGQ